MDETLITLDYAKGRDRFLTLAHQAGARVESHVHPTERGPRGVELATDLAWLGPRDASRVFVCSSGMHGLEGPVGSAIQSTWLESGAARAPPKDVVVCLVHALNAWGFANFARCTENNVDLNRNFADFEAPLPANPEYAHIRDVIRIKEFTPATLAKLRTDYEALREKLGAGRLSIAVNFGQYDDPRGLQYGGNGPEFGVRVFRDHVLTKLKSARDVGLLDWHTGVGDYGEVAFLISGGVDTAAGERAGRWWGAERIRNWRRSQTERLVDEDAAAKKLPKKKFGQLYHELARLIPHATVTGGIIEFGTEKSASAEQLGSFERLMLGTLYELWLRFEDRGDRFSPKHHHHLDAMSECFVPADPDWRRMVLREGPQLMNQAIEGLARS